MWFQDDGPVKASVIVVSGRCVGVGAGSVPNPHEHAP